jgi:hypothetical protein
MGNELAANNLTTVPTEDLFERANVGEWAALDALAERFKDDPKGMIRACRGDLPSVIAKFIIDNVLMDDQLAIKRGISMRVEEIRREVAGPSATPLEQLLADRAALTWLDLHVLELSFAADVKGKSFKEIKARGDRLERAEWRHLRALKTLADVRKLKLPPVTLDLRGHMLPEGAYARLLGAPQTPADYDIGPGKRES